ncbi:probable palmitoyltransferase ZDHHC24 [Periplaneta americana]|uniref:probable palmitoyltransferase ZDHHC24 n=1 Tax=Periplaneta americana TaxID=6978 RepID=UPI0037E9077D
MALRMKARKDILPKLLSEFVAFTFVICIIPTIYWFELYVVLPSFYPLWSLWYTIHFICGTFLMCNITSNFVAVVCTDTSVKGLMLQSTLRPKWHFCSVCESISPPRSWHCDTCNTCIMRRDHHCMFTGCCIGHYNYRFFIIFAVHLLIATAYATYFNSFFMWDRLNFETPMALVKVIFPLAMVAFGIDASETQLFIILCLVTIMGMLFMLSLLIVHFNLIWHGTTTYEKNHKIKDYDLGWKQNFKDVIGENWLLAWFLPFAQLKLPGNGIEWPTLHSLNMETSKSR